MSPRAEEETAESNGANPLLHKKRYRRLLVRSGFSIAAVSVFPLVIMTLINYHQYQEAFHKEMIRPITRLTSNAQRSLEFFLSERSSALTMVIREKSIDELRDQKSLNRLLDNMKRSFGGFVDLGLIDAEGNQISYAGPYQLKGKNYSGQDWFHEVSLQGVHISDVFQGYRRFPHFVIAVKGGADTGDSYILRATFDTEMINEKILDLESHPYSDAFIVNHNGILQTPSRFYGGVLEKLSLPVPPFSSRAKVIETEDAKGEPLVIGYAYVARSPFVVMKLSRPGVMQAGWISLRRDLLLFLAGSVILVLGVVLWGTRYMVNRIREVDIKRATIFHKMEYTNKMAAIGRLGAGVAHEINNPLSIISEKAGLLKDLLTLSDSTPPKEKLNELVDSVLRSVDRCSTITHRLLGFAKHMDVQHEKISLEMLIKEVLSFLEKEASYRNIKITFDIPEDLPTIESDRSQLQQVFLNIINNAFAAVSDDKGVIHISVVEDGDERIETSVTDNGTGISAENLDHIFEPFFTTKKGYGTGLGLSITYGIVEKLGGEIKVNSKVGEGTSFTVVLPKSRNTV
jgi:two-component system NtrC family sensor kinase